MTELPTLPASSRIPALASAVASRGGKLLIVGGWVRDQLRGVASKDFDAEIFGLPVDEIDALLADFDSVGRVGQHFPVWRLRHLPVDIAFPRDGALVYHADRPSSADAAFERAARHRDLTLNAIAWDPIEERTLDPFGGAHDLENRCLRAVDSTTFGADPLRGLRVARLSATLGADVAPETRALCRRLDLGDVAVERKTNELRRMLVEPEEPSRAFSCLEDTGLIRHFAPLARLRETPQDPRWHPEGDVFVHTLMVIDAASQIGRAADLDPTAFEILQWAALCHDLGKPKTTRRDGDRVRAFGHEGEGAEITQRWLTELRLPGRIIEATTALVAHHLAPAQFVGQSAGPRAYRRLARKLAKCDLSLQDLERVARADHLGRTTEEAIRGAFEAGDRFLEIAETTGVEAGVHVDVVSAESLMARGFVPGAALGRALDRAREIQDESGETRPEPILARLEREFEDALTDSRRAARKSEPQDRNDPPNER